MHHLIWTELENIIYGDIFAAKKLTLLKIKAWIARRIPQWAHNSEIGSSKLARDNQIARKNPMIYQKRIRKSKPR